jgi:glutamate:GABA antiporter
MICLSFGMDGVGRAAASPRPQDIRDASSAASEAPQLARSLGLLDVTLYIVTAGSSLQWAATAAAAGPSSLVVWLLAGLAMFLPLAICVVFLSSRYPDQGGLYIWSKRAFGPFAGFMTGWMYWTSNLPFFPAMLYFTAGSALFWSGRADTASRASPAYFIAFSVAAIAVAAVLNVRGLRRATLLNSAGAIARWLGTLLLVALGLSTWWRYGPATTINRHTLIPEPNLREVQFWATIVFAWIGAEGISLMGGEIRDPRRTVPRALALAAPMIVAVYLLGTAAVLLSVSTQHTSALYGVMDAISISAARLGLVWLIPLGVLCVVFDRLGSVCLWLGTVARLPFVAGIDNYLPASFAKLHPRHGSPAVAIWTQAALAVLFVLLGQAGTSVSGAYNVLVDMMVAASLLPFLPLFGAAIKLSGATAVAGESRIPGGRVTVVVMGAVGMATSTGAIVLACVPAPGEEHPTLAVLKVVGVTAAVLLSGAALYAGGARRARRLERQARLALPVTPA